MKKLINKTIILSLFVALTGCNDWLDVSPKADMKAEDLFGTEAGFRDALVGVYALMCGFEFFVIHLHELIFFLSLKQSSLQGLQGQRYQFV